MTRPAPGAFAIACLILAFGVLFAAVANAQPVRDHTPLLTDQTFGEREITYSFPSAPPPDIRARFPASGIATFRPYTEAAKNMVRACLQQWDDASGLKFVEVPENGTIRIMQFDLRKLDPGMATGGNTYPPGPAAIDSDMFIQIGRTTDQWLCLHEIGHALGLKHPDITREWDGFRGVWFTVPYLATDLRRGTIMSPSSRTLRALGPLDIAAVQALYGPPQ